MAAGLLLPARAADLKPAPPDSSNSITLLGENGLLDDSDAEASSTTPADDKPPLSVNVGGSLRFNALFRDYGSHSVADRKLGNGGFAQILMTDSTLAGCCA